METCGNLILEMYHEENKKTEWREERQSKHCCAVYLWARWKPRISCRNRYIGILHCLITLSSRYTLKVTETSVSLVELQKMGGLAFHYFWYIVLQTTASNIHGLIQKICEKNKPNLGA